MNTVTAKRVQIDAQRAQRLEQIAAINSTTEDALVAQALDLLFREQEKQDASTEDWEVLRQLEKELGPAPRRQKVTIDPKEIVSVVGTPINQTQIRHVGEPS